MTDRERALREAAEIADIEVKEAERDLRAEPNNPHLTATSRSARRIRDAILARIPADDLLRAGIEDAQHGRVQNLGSFANRISTPDTSADGGERRSLARAAADGLTESDERRSKGQPSSEGATSRTRSPAGVSGIPPMNTEGGTTKECLDGIHVFDGPPIQTVEALRGHVGSMVDAIPKDDEAWLRISLRLASGLLWDSRLLDNADRAMDQAGNHIMLVSAGGSARQQLERRDREEARSYSDE